MSIKKINGGYRLDVRVGDSTSKRYVRKFLTKAEALQFKNKLLSGRVEIQAVQAIIDTRRLNDLITIWFDLHGRSLKSSIDTKNRLLNLSENLGNPLAYSINSEQLAFYRKSRLDSGISPSTLNRELITLKALFRELNRLSVIDYLPSILNVRKIRETRTELTYLTDSQITELREQVALSKNESLPFVVLICLITGARWSEAQGLTVKDCVNYGFNFVDTKNGHNRFIPVHKILFNQIKDRLALRPFSSCYSAFRSAFSRTLIKAPDGQLAHILRHTFASHFLMNGGNIVALQKILGHSSLNITMRYSHLAPEYLNQAIDLNPLSKFNKIGNFLVTKETGTKKPVDETA